MSHNKYLFQITWAIYVMLVKGMNECKSYNFCFKQLTMNFIYIGSLASSIRSTATIKQFIRPKISLNTVSTNTTSHTVNSSWTT